MTPFAPAVALALLAATPAPTPAAKPPGAPAAPVTSPDRFRYERPVTPGARGPNRLEVDLALLAGTAPGLGLADLRMFDAQGREAGYLLVPPVDPSPSWRPGRILPVQPTKEESGFEVDLGQPTPVLRLRLDGLPAPFLKRARLEGSGDRARWTLLAAEATLFDLPDQDLRQTEIAFPAGEYRYLRITWDDRSSGRVPPPPSAHAQAAVRMGLPVPLRAAATFTRRESEPGRSRFRIRLPGLRLPVQALVLAVGPGHLLREARVSEARLQGDAVEPATLGTATLRKAEIGGLVAADLRVPVRAPQGAELELVVDDGPNPPLELASVTLEIAPQPWIYFESEDGALLRACYGDPKLEHPRYDLESVRDSLSRLRPAAAAWGEPVDRAPAAEPAASTAALPLRGAAVDPARFPYRRELSGLEPGLVALALDASVLAHSRALSDLRVVDGEGRQVPYVVEKRDEPLALDLPALAREAAAAAGATQGESRYPVHIREARPQGARLVLRTRARVFERTVVLIEHDEDARRGEASERAVAERGWRHAVGSPGTELEFAL